MPENQFSVICVCGTHVKDFMFVEDDPEHDASIWEAWCLKCMRAISVAISEEKLLEGAAAS